jgi:hypothetical protein
MPALTWEAIDEIRAHPELSLAVLAKRFRVSKSNVHLVRSGQTWQEEDRRNTWHSTRSSTLQRAQEKRDEVRARATMRLGYVPEWGTCFCGCGERTNPCKETRAQWGHIRGEPLLYRAGHQRRKSPIEYCEEDHGFESPCWIWQRGRDGHGYPTLLKQDGKVLGIAYRVYYERENGPIPEGHDLHHRCLQKLCVRPGHLEPLLPESHQKAHAHLRAQAA